MKNTILTIYDGSAKLARLGDPAIRVRKSGRIEFNTMAMMLLDLKEGGSVVFARESLAPNRWYVRKSSDTTGIKVNHYHAAFCRKLAKDILLDTPPSPKSVKIAIEIAETTIFSGGYHQLLIEK